MPALLPERDRVDGPTVRCLSIMRERSYPPRVAARLARLSGAAAALLAGAAASLLAQGDDAVVRARARTWSASTTSIPLVVDGRLDERAWTEAPAIRGFRQVEPQQGAPSSHATEVRVVADARFLYVAFTCHDSLGAAGIRVRDLRRDFDSRNNDFVGVVIDPFGDGRTAVGMEVTPWGAMQDFQVFDGDAATRNEAWDGPWQARAERTATGWTAELAIPWTMLRYPDPPGNFRLNFYRRARRTNELSAWGDWPRALDASRLEYGGQLVGISPPVSRGGVRVRPFVVGTDRRATPGSVAPDGRDLQAGGELLWSPTPTSLLEATINTDFAQADVDNEVVNLTRFSVFFPERRQFFLEAASLFEAGTSGALQVRPFFSRRIGLADDGTPVPVRGGLRFVRQGAGVTMGGLVLHQGASAGLEGSTFGALRVSRPVASRGRVGALLATRTDRADSGGTTHDVVGAVDAFWRFNDRLTTTSTLSVNAPGGGGDPGVSASGSLDYRSSTWTARLAEVLVSRNYAPRTGFVSRTDVFMHRPMLGYDWRPAWRPRWLRTFYWFAASELYTDPDLRRLQESSTELYVDFLLENGALFYPDVFFVTQRLPAPFSPVPGVTIPAGEYQFWRPNVYVGSDQSRRVSADVRAYTGRFYDRLLDEVTTTANVVADPRLGVQLSHNYNRFRGQGEPITTHVMRGVLRGAVNPRLQLSGTWQYNSARGRQSLNARLSWEYRPLSFLYVILNDARAAGPNETRFNAPGRELLVKWVHLGGR